MAGLGAARAVYRDPAFDDAPRLAILEQKTTASAQAYRTRSRPAPLAIMKRGIAELCGVVPTDGIWSLVPNHRRRRHRRCIKFKAIFDGCTTGTTFKPSNPPGIAGRRLLLLPLVFVQSVYVWKIWDRGQCRQSSPGGPRHSLLERHRPLVMFIHRRRTVPLCPPLVMKALATTEVL